MHSNQIPQITCHILHVCTREKKLNIGIDSVMEAGEKQKKTRTHLCFSLRRRFETLLILLLFPLLVLLCRLLPKLGLLPIRSAGLVLGLCYIRLASRSLSSGWLPKRANNLRPGGMFGENEGGYEASELSGERREQ